MKRILSYIVVLALGLAISVSCGKNILDQVPTDRYTDLQVWNDPGLIESHLADLYNSSVTMINDAVCMYAVGNNPALNVDFNANAGWASNMAYSAEGEGPVHTTTIADEAMYSKRGAQNHYADMKVKGLLPNSSSLRWWSNGYYLNRQLNHFIDNIATSPVSNADERLAEAKFLRAYNYFSMVKRYGGVPIILHETPIDAPDEEMYPKRKTEKEVWDFVISEALEAAELLPETDVKGRANKYAAYALAARAAMYAGSIAQYGTVQMDGLLGIPASESAKYYQTAKEACKKIIDSGKYALYNEGADKVETLRNVFLDETEANREAIMVKQHGGPTSANARWSWGVCVTPRPAYCDVGQYSLPYYDFVEQFGKIDGSSGVIDEDYLQSHAWTMEEFLGDRDPRLGAWFWTNGTSWPGAVGSPIWPDNTVTMYNGIMTADNKVWRNTAAPVYSDGVHDIKCNCLGDQIRLQATASLDHTGFGIMKYLSPEDDNVTWFVYSTVDYQIFRYAEILLNYAEVCYELNEPAEALWAVNEIRTRAGVAALGSVDREAIRHERMLELCFENHRYWDLRRWRTAVEVLSKPHVGINYLLDWSSYVIDQKHPKFRIELIQKIDDKIQDPTFPENNYYFPIGDATIAANHNLVENPGY